MKSVIRFALAAPIAVSVTATFTDAQGEPTAKPQSQPATAEQKDPKKNAEKPTNILPIIDYSGDLWTRPWLTGDWGGARNDLAKKGIQATLDFVQTVQSVTDGGKELGTEYGGSADLCLNFDLQQMGAVPGAFIKIRGESRYGDSVNDIAGPILPVNTDAFFPITKTPDEDIAFTLTDVTYYQFLSEHFGVLIGKFDTLDGDANEFASGRGTAQFMNTNFIYNPVISLTVPYSTLGGGIIVLPSKYVTITSSMFNTTDSSTTSGFNDLGEGWSWASEVDVQYQLGDLPGGQNVGFVYGWDNTFHQINGKFVFTPGQGITPPTRDDTWASYWSGWQYVYAEEHKDGPCVVNDGRPDLQGIGLFARLGFADQDTNPIEVAASAGVGARGLIPGRENDVLGVGCYYTKIQTNRLTGLLGIQDHAQGLEAFYNVAITPAALLTFDAQFVSSPLPGTNTATILGVRLELKF